jgi:hypothetical protein
MDIQEIEYEPVNIKSLILIKINGPHLFIEVKSEPL